MAGDWIKMRGNLWDDPRVSALVDATDSSEAAIVGGLYWLWATADQHTENGFMPGLTLRQIDRKTGVPGLGQALVDIGWLTVADDGVTIENFTDHNGTSAKTRAVDAKRKATVRDVSEKSRTKTGKAADKSGGKSELEKEKRREEYSVPNGTGGDAAMQAELTKTELWTAGKSLLAAQGMPKAQCGSFVGKLCKDWTDAIVIEAVRTTVVKRPVDAAEFLVATCQTLAGQRDKTEPGWRTEQRERTQIAAPGVAIGGKPADQFFIDAEVKHVTANSLD